MILTYVSIENLNFQLMKIIEFNKTFFEFEQLEIFNIFKTNIIVDIAHFCFIFVSLKRARLILQFDCFMNLCVQKVIVSKNAMKIDIFVSKKLISRFDKNVKKK